MERISYHKLRVVAHQKCHYACRRRRSQARSETPSIIFPYAVPHPRKRLSFVLNCAQVSRAFMEKGLSICRQFLQYVAVCYSNVA
jgi:hypothetical protein